MTFRSAGTAISINIHFYIPSAGVLYLACCALISYPCQVVRYVSFSENFAYALHE